MERLIEGEVRKRLDKYVNNSETFDIHNGNEFTLNNVTLKQEFAKTLFRSVPALAHLLEPFELLSRPFGDESSDEEAVPFAPSPPTASEGEAV